MGNTQYRCQDCGWKDEIYSYCIKCREQQKMRKDADEWERQQREKLREQKEQLEKIKIEYEKKKREEIDKLNNALKNSNFQKIELHEDPYTNMIALNPNELIKNIGDRVIECAMAGEVLSNVTDHVRNTIKNNLKDEYKLFAPELDKYDDYANALKGVEMTFVEQLKPLDTSMNKIKKNIEDKKSPPENKQKRLKNQFNQLKENTKIKLQLEYAKKCCENMQQDYQFFINLCDNRYQQYNLQGEGIDEMIKEFVNQIPNKRNHKKKLAKNNLGTYVGTGAVIGGVAGGITGGVIGGGGGIVGGALIGGSAGALFGALAWCIFGRRDEKNIKLDGQKQKEALQNLGRVVSEVLKEQAKEWETKKQEAKAKQVYWTTEINRLTELLENTNKLSDGCNDIAKILEGNVADYNIEDLEREFTTLQTDLSTTLKGCQGHQKNWEQNKNNESND